MKVNKIFLLLLFLFFTSPLLAQNFYGGILGGFNASQIDGDGYRGYFQPGLIAGTWMQNNLSDRTYWGMEIKFSQKGVHKRPTKIDPTWYRYRLNYIDLPVVLGFQYQKTVSAFAGLSFNYLLSRDGKNQDGSFLFENYEDIAPWEIGSLIGVKVDFKELVSQSWAEKIVLDVRFQYSLFSMRYPHKFVLNFSPYYGSFNNLISTTLYYRIELGKN
jgi:hypothetical protein